jgi:hypothetical protein
MAITASAIINAAARLLFDINNVKWTRAELLSYLSDGQRLIVMLQPSVSNAISSIKLVPGTRQSLPSTGWILLDVIRNMGTTGLVPGRAIRVVSRQLLDSYNPDWSADTKRSVVQNFTFDPKEDSAFFVYPPSDGTNYVEVNFSEIPATVTNENATLTLPDVYSSALLDYVMYRACSKVVDYAPGMPVAVQYLNSFNQMIGAKVSAQQADSPNVELVQPVAGRMQ